MSDLFVATGEFSKSKKHPTISIRPQIPLSSLAHFAPHEAL